MKIPKKIKKEEEPDETEWQMDKRQKEYKAN